MDWRVWAGREHTPAQAIYHEGLNSIFNDFFSVRAGCKRGGARQGPPEALRGGPEGGGALISYTITKKAPKKSGLGPLSVLQRWTGGGEAKRN